jgi:hypothetical protein
MKTKEYFNEGTPFESMKPALSKDAVGGTQIRVNNGFIETLIKLERPYGLFLSESGYKVVRNITTIKDSEIVNGESVERGNLNGCH